MTLYRRVAHPGTLETVEELAEALADAAGIWGSCPDAERESCSQEAYCRLCIGAGYPAPHPGSRMSGAGPETARARVSPAQ